jgi:SAM-dependent methyltransferase
MSKPDASLTVLEEERIVPWGDPGLLAWHLARYRFALPLVTARRVLDIGCGEGYGTALLAGQAREAIGLDYSPAAVQHAAKSYVRPNLTFRLGDAAALESSLGAFDVITCFEVLEHLEDGEALFAGITKLLSRHGVLVLSTPNKLVDAPFGRHIWGERNEYHVGLLTPSELRRHARRHFRNVTLYGQGPRGNTLHALLKTVDIFNLRHRLIHSPRVQRQLATTIMGQDWRQEKMSFRFSRLLVRQSPITVGVASGPRVREGSKSAAER